MTNLLTNSFKKNWVTRKIIVGDENAEIISRISDGLFDVRNRVRAFGVRVYFGDAEMSNQSTDYKRLYQLPPMVISYLEARYDGPIPLHAIEQAEANHRQVNAIKAKRQW